MVAKFESQYYPTGQNHSSELKLAKLVTAKIAKDLNPPKLISKRC